MSKYASHAQNDVFLKIFESDAKILFGKTKQIEYLEV
jgi:hypothetical protein